MTSVRLTHRDGARHTLQPASRQLSTIVTLDFTP
jgi:hypothetical protein